MVDWGFEVSMPRSREEMGNDTSLWLPATESHAGDAAEALQHVKPYVSMFLPPALQICSLV